MVKAADIDEKSSDIVAPESVEDLLRQALSRIDALSDKVISLENTSKGLPLVESPEQLISKLKAGEATSGRKTIDPQNRKGGYRSDDIVELVLGEKRDSYITAKLVEETDEILGVVVRPMYRRRKDDLMKINVYFPFLGRGKNGEDGVMENELKLYKAA